MVPQGLWAAGRRAEVSQKGGVLKEEDELTIDIRGHLPLVAGGYGSYQDGMSACTQPGRVTCPEATTTAAYLLV